MARAKNTDRSDARRKFREARAAELTTSRPTPEDDGDGRDRVTGRPLTTVVVSDADARAATSPRRFRIPNVRKDLADLPNLFRERRLLYLPFILIVAGFAVALLLDAGVITGGSPQQIAVVFLQFTLVPTGLLVFFLGGFIAPRASYLIGFLLGLLDGILFYSWLASRPPLAVQTDPSAVTQDMSAIALTTGIAYAVVIGTLGAAFAAWYRTFLRTSQERARASRLEREAKQRAAAKAEARTTKRPARPASR